MAVYTDVSDYDVIALLKDYDIGELTSLKGIAEGVENSNFLLITTQGTYILTLFEKRVNAEDLPFFMALMQHYNAHGVPAPLPIKRKTQDIISQIAGRPAVIISFLEGVWPKNPSVEQAADLGHTLGRMHLATANFTMKRKNGLQLEDWHNLISSSAEKARNNFSGDFEFIESELDWLKRQWRNDLPQSVVHADLFPDNVFFIDGKVCGVIDYYFACTEMLVYDLAITFNAWCFDHDGQLKQDHANALMAAYQSQRPLSQDEMSAFPIMLRGAAMRFLSTRLYDWVNTPEDALVQRKDPLEYVKIGQFHRDHGAPERYGLKT